MLYNWKRNTVIFLTSQAISIFGSSLVQYAITWYITLATKSGIWATLSIICGFVPIFILSPFAGVWADRYNRKLLIIIADGSIALCTLIIAIVFLTGGGAIWLLLVALGIRGLGSAIQNPCVGAMLPDMVPTQHLTRVNGINGSIQALITLASPMLSGALLGLSTLEAIFFIDVGTAAAAIFIMVVFFRLPQKRPSHENAVPSAAAGYFAEFKQGISYIVRTPYLRSFFLYCLIFIFMVSPVAFLTPLHVARVYGDEVWRLTVLEVSFSVGMMVGGLVIAAWGGFRNRIWSIALAAFVMAGCTLALGFPISLVLYFALMGIFGLAMPVLNTPAQVMLQEKVDPAFIGRVFGVMTMINTGVMPLGMLLFGPLADVIDIRWLLLATGLVMLGTALVMVRDKTLINAGWRDEPQEESKTQTPEGAQ